MARKVLTFGGKLIQKLSTLPHSQNILHQFIDGWILFQRNSFDHFDESGDPFVSQIFLIEISSGRYIHRSQGHKVDQGTSLDLEVLTGKLIHVFRNTKPCSGVPIQRDQEQTNMLVILDYPFQRHASKECQYYYEAPQIKEELDEDDSKNWTSCSPCQKAWQDINSKSMRGVEGQVYYEDDHLEVSVSSPPTGFLQDLIKTEDEETMSPVMDFDYEVLNSGEEGDIWSNQSMAINPMDSPTKDEELEPSVQSKKKGNGKKKGSGKKKTAGKGKQEYSCKWCSQTFETSVALARHRRNRLMKKRAQRKVGCLECDKKDIITFMQLGDHVAEKHPEKLDEYDKYLPQHDDPTDMKEPMKCSICDFFNNGGTLNSRHRELYHDVGDYVCQECQEPNMTYYDLMIHNYQKHRKPTKYLAPSPFGLDTFTQKDGRIQFKKSSMSKCHLCSKVYKRDYGLITHMRSHHLWGMFNCNPCDESCHYSKDLSAHVLQFHRDNPEIKCPSCLKDFNLKEDHEAFNSHYKTCVLQILNERQQKYLPSQGGKPQNPFQCEICGKSYTVKWNLDRHMDAHQGIFRFKCSYCAFATNHKHVLEDHERTHMAERALTNGTANEIFHQCEQCVKRFSTTKLLKRHVQIVHEGKKRSCVCKDCGESFKHYVALYKHKKDRHGFVSKSKRGNP